MKESDIRKYAGLMRELGLTGLEITEDNKVVRLERNVTEPLKETVTPLLTEDAPEMTDSADYISVKSPMVGVFYASPAENAEPFVALGDRVEKGKPLCIIEAMKLMNEICAEEEGIVAEICVTSGQVVEYGTELFRLRR
ncbi:MAG: acetyl-CoA carboxylase biotin carboxyl carrier protein [Clostridia bacterium]